MNVPPRFSEQVEVNPNGCWLWRGPRTGSGVPVLFEDARHVMVSRETRQREGRDGHRMQVQRLDRLPEAFLDALLASLARARGVTVATPQGHLASIAVAMRAMSEAVEQLAVIQQPTLPFDRRKEIRHA